MSYINQIWIAGAVAGLAVMIAPSTLARPVAVQCLGDIDGNDVVDTADLLILLAQWGPCPRNCDGDIDDDGIVGTADLIELLGDWGLCPSTVQYTVSALIDGSSRLVLDDDTVQWFHLTHAAPGRHLCVDGVPIEPTIINNLEWFPQWPDDPDCENRGCLCFSDMLKDSDPFLPNEAPLQVTLTPIDCRQDCTIVVFPGEVNGYRLVIEFDDKAVGGSAWYEIQIDIKYPG